MNKNGFTLVELLAVIVILAVILVISVPKITETIESSRLSALEASAKTILNSAEQTLAAKLILDENYAATNMDCGLIADINESDYDSCKVSFTNNVASIDLNGKGKFEGYHCEGSKDSLSCTKGDIEPVYYAFASYSSITDWDSTETDYNNLTSPYGKPDVFLQKKGDEVSACAVYNGNKYCVAPNSYEGNLENTINNMEGVKNLASGSCKMYDSGVTCEIHDVEPNITCSAWKDQSATCYTGNSWLVCGIYNDGSMYCGQD